MNSPTYNFLRSDEMSLKLILCVLALAVFSKTAMAEEVDDFISHLKDEDPGVRAEAAKALGNIGDPRAVDPLILALNDSDSGVRR